METLIKEAGILEDVNMFLDAIYETKEYKEFQIQKEKIKRFPEIKAKIDELRLENYELQNRPQSDNLMVELEQLQKKYENFLETPLVADFMQAELDFCRMIQNINVYITKQLDFE